MNYRISLLLAAGVLSGAPAARGQPTITEYPLPTAAAKPTAIVKGPDGNLWIAETAAHKIARITASGTVTEYAVPTADNQVVGIAAGPDGNLWFTEAFTAGEGKIGKITPAGAITEFSVPSYAPLPAAIVTGPDGNLWFTDPHRNAVGRFTPAGTFREYPLPSALASPCGITVGPDGNLWFSEIDGNRVGKFVLTSVPADTQLTLSPASLSFTAAVEGRTPAAQSLTITSPTSASFTANAEVPVQVDDSWLKISPSGTLTGSQTITVTVDQTGFGSYGDYFGNISLTLGNITQTVLVTLHLTAPPSEVKATPVSLGFDYAMGTYPPPAQGIAITDVYAVSGAVALTVSYAIASPSGGTWLSLTTHTGSPLPSGSSGTSGMGIQAHIDPAGLTPGIYTAAITIAPTGGTPVVVPVTLTVTVPTRPVIITAVVNAASFFGGAVAPGELVTIGGSGLGPVNPLGLTLDSSGKVATSLGGVSVTFSGYPAPLIYASDTQINCVVPYEVSGVPNVLLQVNYFVQSAALALNTTAVVPGIFTLDSSGIGTVAAANSTGGYNGPNNPAVTGSTITFYLTGEGQTKPGGVTGGVTAVNTSSGGPLTPQPQAGAPAVSIGGQPATVTFYGEAPGMVAGIMQLNIQIPAGLTGGRLPLIASLGGAFSQSYVAVWVR